MSTRGGFCLLREKSAGEIAAKKKRIPANIPLHNFYRIRNILSGHEVMVIVFNMSPASDSGTLIGIH